jgi:hypothetical protein
MQRLLILGGGFSGVMAALNAVDENDRHAGDIAVTLVSATPFLTIRPRLYERAPETCARRLPRRWSRLASPLSRRRHGQSILRSGSL